MLIILHHAFDINAQYLQHTTLALFVVCGIIMPKIKCQLLQDLTKGCSLNHFAVQLHTNPKISASNTYSKSF